jgi:uncharacterized protein YdiU (UPF0061 family)
MTNMRIGYGRVSTTDQNPDSQKDALSRANVHQIFMDAFTGTKASRPELDKMRQQLRSGDTLVITRLDRLGRSARDLLKAVDQRSKSVNLVKRISDPHETWFIKHAAEEGYKFIGVDKKNERKKELIKNLQEALDTRNLIVTPWCDDLISEFTSCQWSETVDDKIVGSRRFHLLDALQYAVDNLPKPVYQAPPQTHNQWLKKANQERILAEAQKKQRHRKQTVGRLVARKGRVLRGLHTI